MHNQLDSVTPITYAELAKLPRLGYSLPISGENESGETVIISQEPFEDTVCYRLDTYQNNDWIRINRYYPDGTVDETYER